jgi:probable rRNA maturation factor
VSLLLCDDAAIQALNREYRSVDAPTDVLAFAQEEGPALPLGWADEEIPHILGDVVISVETARRQAADQGWALQEETEALLVHGLLHLLGYDHDVPAERDLMRAREAELLGERCIWAHSTLHSPLSSHAERDG